VVRKRARRGDSGRVFASSASIRRTLPTSTPRSDRAPHADWGESRGRRWSRQYSLRSRRWQDRCRPRTSPRSLPHRGFPPLLPPVPISPPAAVAPAPASGSPMGPYPSKDTKHPSSGSISSRATLTSESDVELRTVGSDRWGGPIIFELTAGPEKWGVSSRLGSQAREKIPKTMKRRLRK
jgi:hypothetical protein